MWTQSKARAPWRCRECGWYAWRKCRVCDRGVCSQHRHGAGNWFRCERCPYEALAQILRAHHQALRAEYRAQQAAQLRRAFIRRKGSTLPLVIGAAHVEGRQVGPVVCCA